MYNNHIISVIAICILVYHYVCIILLYDIYYIISVIWLDTDSIIYQSAFRAIILCMTISIISSKTSVTTIVIVIFSMQTITITAITTSITMVYSIQNHKTIRKVTRTRSRGSKDGAEAFARANSARLTV